MKLILLYTLTLSEKPADLAAQNLYQSPDWLALPALAAEDLFFDFDNHSESFLFEQAFQLIKQAEAVIFLLNVKEQTNCPRLLVFFNKVIKYAEKTLLLLIGSAAFPPALMARFPQYYAWEKPDKPAIAALLQDWASGRPFLNPPF
ncbi:MAG: hypothetical protein HC913_07000 [Microscillaceae bacterium]|nr:hypothetical protein [Microscillaceae bacterium]